MYSQLGKDNEFLYEYEHKAHLCVEGKPSKLASTGKIWVWETTKNPVTDLDFGEVGTGTWKQKEDHRKDTLYNTDGSYSIGSDYNGQSYSGIGSLPVWLTNTPKPSQFHNLVNGEWVEDIDARLESDKASERAWRDNEINSIEWMKQRHRDEVELEINTTLSNSEYQELIAYIQGLRDYPLNPLFPDNTARPIKPSFLV